MTQTATAQAPRHNVVTPLFACVTRPLATLRAMERLAKFRRLDSHALNDMGLTRSDANGATLADFMDTPHL